MFHTTDLEKYLWLTNSETPPFLLSVLHQQLSKPGANLVLHLKGIVQKSFSL